MMRRTSCRAAPGSLGCLAHWYDFMLWRSASSVPMSSSTGRVVQGSRPVSAQYCSNPPTQFGNPGLMKHTRNSVEQACMVIAR